MPDERLLACKLLTELTPEQAIWSQMGLCSECAAPIWYVPRNLRLRARIVCRPCAWRLIGQMAAYEVALVEPATQAIARLDAAERN